MIDESGDDHDLANLACRESMFVVWLVLSIVDRGWRGPTVSGK